MVLTIPGALDLGSLPPTLLQEHQVAEWKGDCNCYCRIPQTAAECLFFTFSFEKFLLLNPATAYKEGPVLLRSPPLQLDWGLSGSGPNTAQLSTLPSQRPQSPWVYYFVLIPLPGTSSNQVSLGVAQALLGKGGSR